MDRSWREFLRGLVTQAIEVGHFRKDVDSEQFVWELCGIYLAHHTTDRFLRDPEATQRAETAFEALIARARP